MPFARVADLPKEVLPVGDTGNPETIRTHLYATAERIEEDLEARIVEEPSATTVTVREKDARLYPVPSEKNAGTSWYSILIHYSLLSNMLR